MERARLVAVARGGWAVFLLACPAGAVAALTGIEPTTRDQRVLRLLGARQLVQAAVSIARPSRRTLAAGSVVDALHAGSCLGMAAVDRRWRRGALIGALDATAFALAGYLGVRDAERVRASAVRP